VRFDVFSENPLSQPHAEVLMAYLQFFSLVSFSPSANVAAGQNDS